MSERQQRIAHDPSDPASYPAAYLELRRIAALVYLGHLEVWTLLDPLAKTQEATANKED